jgi:hypothetical protein
MLDMLMQDLRAGLSQKNLCRASFIGHPQVGICSKEPQSASNHCQACAHVPTSDLGTELRVRAARDELNLVGHLIEHYSRSRMVFF